MRPFCQRHSGAILFVVRCVVAAIFTGLLARLAYDIEHWPDITIAHHWVLIGAVCAYGTMLLLLALRWQLIIRLLGDNGRVEVPILRLVKLIWAGLAAGQALPSSIMGDAVRVLGLRKYNVPLTRALGGIALDRLIGLTALLLLALPGLVSTFSTANTPNVEYMTTIWLLLIVGAVVVGVFLVPRIVRHKLCNLLCSARSFLRPDTTFSFFFSTVAGATVVALIGHGLNVTIFVLLTLAMNLQIDVLSVLLVVPAALILAMLPLSLGGWGIREFSIAGGLTLLGQDHAAAIVAAVAFGMFHLACCLPAVLFLVHGATFRSDN